MCGRWFACGSAYRAGRRTQRSLNDGLVTIRAQETQITDILAEWGRVGNTAIIDADELVGKTVTIELVDVPEAQALRTLLRSASGYMVAPRGTKSVGVSRFDRILILATSKPAARVATAASPGSAVTSATTAGGSSRNADGSRRPEPRDRKRSNRRLRLHNRARDQRQI